MLGIRRIAALSAARGVIPRVRSLAPRPALRHEFPAMLSSSPPTENAQVLVAVDKGIGGDPRMALVTMGRKPVNSLNLDLIHGLTAAIHELEQDPDVQGFVLASGCKKVFCAGLDLMVMHEPKEDELAEFWTALQNLWAVLYGTRLATVAAVQGAAPAAGCLLAISCDYRVMGKGYGLGMNETKFGLVAPPWFQSTLINTVGNRKAEHMLMRGTMVPSGEALKIGLIDEEVEEENVLEAAQKELLALVSVSDKARHTTKMALRMPLIGSMKSVFEMDKNWFMEWVQAPEIQEGLSAYISSLKKAK